jgi:hypothetical protein
LLEVRYMGNRTAYAIPQRYWLDSKLTPRWAFFKRVSYDPEDGLLAITMIAEQHPASEQPAIAVIASDNQNDSNPLSLREQPAITAIVQNADDASSQAAPHEEIYTSSDISLQTTLIDTGANGAEALRGKKKKKESNASSANQNTPAAANQGTNGTPPAPVSANKEKNSSVEQDRKAEAERVGRERTRNWLLAELAETRKRAADYKLSSTERLQAKQRLKALEWSWRLEFPDEPVG